MAHSIRFGVTTDPCRYDSESHPQVEEYDEKANDDPEKLQQCPFDKNHQIRACRFPYHLIKCRKNHPKLAKELKTCPFNARHLVPKLELTRHIETCDNRVPVDCDDVGGNENKHLARGWHAPVSTWINPNATEDWEQEAEREPTEFVWGVDTDFFQIPGTRLTRKPGQSFRAPKNLPWCDF